MGAHTVQEATTIDGAVTRALSEAGVKDGSTIRQALIHDAMVYDLVEVCVPDESGKSVSLEVRLSQMREDSRWKGDFTKAAAAPNRPQAPTAAGAILTPTREQFAEISSGRSVVR